MKQIADRRNGSRNAVGPAGSRGPLRARRWGSFLLAALLGALAATVGLLAIFGTEGIFGAAGSSAAARRAPGEGQGYRLERLLAEPPAALAKRDVAEMNLLAAAGLPGAGSVSVPQCLEKLDHWAARVDQQTRRGLSEFHADPEKYKGSEEYFRVHVLVQTLKENIGAAYVTAGVRRADYAGDWRGVFLHGLLAGGRGTYLSLPVLHVAVGRRLGYPLSLVLAKSHVFVRWEEADPRKRFNVDVASGVLNSFRDEHYKTWPVRLTPAELRGGRYLRSLNPPEELALFLSVRGHCLMAAGRIHEAEIAYAHAHRLAPHDQAYLGYLADAVGRETSWPAFADRLSPRPGAQGPHSLPDPLAELRRIEAFNAQNRRLPGRTMPPPHLPQPSRP